MRYLSFFTILLASVLLLAANQNAPAADADAKADFTLSPVRISQLRASKYVYASVLTKLDKTGPTLGAKLGEMAMAMADGKFTPSGAPVIVYQPIGGAASQNVNMLVGYPVFTSAGVQGYSVGNLDSIRCATALFMGSTHQISSAYKQIYKQIADNGWTPSGLYRERYFYWESVDSPNNIVLIEIALRN